MPDATVTAATIRPGEAEHFGKLARDWWDPKGSSAMLHRMNPVRLAFLRSAIDAHWGGDPESVRPLAGKRALDVGCGAGLLAEPLARLGADVTGVDAAHENVAAARDHAAGSGLAIDYRHGEGIYLLRVRRDPSTGRTRVLLDGTTLDDNAIPLRDDARIHHVDIALAPGD